MTTLEIRKLCIPWYSHIYIYIEILFIKIYCTVCHNHAYYTNVVNGIKCHLYTKMLITQFAVDVSRCINLVYTYNLLIFPFIFHLIITL